MPPDAIGCWMNTPCTEITNPGLVPTPSNCPAMVRAGEQAKVEAEAKGKAEDAARRAVAEGRLGAVQAAVLAQPPGTRLPSFEASDGGDPDEIALVRMLFDGTDPAKTVEAFYRFTRRNVSTSVPRIPDDARAAFVTRDEATEACTKRFPAPHDEFVERDLQACLRAVSAAFEDAKSAHADVLKAWVEHAKEDYMTVPRGIAITARWPWDGSSVPMEYRSYRFDEGRYLMWTLGTACSDHRPVGPDWLVDTGPKMFTVAQAMDGEVLTFAAWPMSESDAKSRRRAIESTANLQFAVVVTDVLEVHPCKVTATQRIDGWPRPVALHPVAYRFCGGSVREVRDCEEWLTPP